MQYMSKGAHCLWEACGEVIHYGATVTTSALTDITQSVTYQVCGKQRML